MRSSSHQLLLFRDQRLEPGDQVTFARRFGSVQVHVMNQYHAEGYPEIYYLSNLVADGRPSGKHPDRGTVHWHTDGSWARRTGQATLLYAVEVPAAGGETRFASMYDAYEALDEGMRQRLAATARGPQSRFLAHAPPRRGSDDRGAEEGAAARGAPDRAHPPGDRAQVHLSRRPCLVHRGHAVRPGAAADRGSERGHHRRPARVYTHRWRPGDLVIWDNRCMLHKAEPYDVAAEARVMRRCTVVGEVPI